MKILQIIANTTFRPMNDADYEGLAGAGPDALIGETGDWTIVVEGNDVTVIDEQGDETQYRLGSLS